MQNVIIVKIKWFSWFYNKHVFNWII